MLEAAKKPLKWFQERKEHLDATPIEAVPDFVRPISSLDDIRAMMAQVSKEAAEQGLESFEEFYDFGEDSDFEDIPAPAQMKHDAVLLARDRDFEGEVLAAKEKYREKLNTDARAALLKELRDKKKAEKAAAEAAEED